jgi:hypothetical protein
MNTRVQIPAYTDAWMRGDRYGEIVKITKHSERYVGVESSRKITENYELAHVRLDKSGKTMKFILDDCTMM